MTKVVFKTKSTALKIALAGMALVAMPVCASSSLNIYGTVDMWAGGSKPIGAKSSATTQSGGMQTSYFGIGGSEQISDNLKAVFALEAYMRVNTGEEGRFGNNDGLFKRSAYVGLQGDFGKLVIGRTTTPYFVSTILFNPLDGSFAFSPAIFHTYGVNGNAFGGGGAAAHLIGDSGWDNSVLYTSPNIGGLTVNLQYARGSADRNSGVKDKESSAQKLGGNALYFNGPFSATVAMQRVNFESNAGDLLGNNIRNQRAMLAGAAYDFSVVKVYGQYQNIQNNTVTGRNIKLNGGQLGVKVPVGQAGNVLASYAYTKTTGAKKDTRKTWAIAYEHSLSKRTQLYSAYFRDSVDSLGNGNNVGVGVKHAF